MSHSPRLHPTCKLFRACFENSLLIYSLSHFDIATNVGDFDRQDSGHTIDWRQWLGFHPQPRHGLCHQPL
uniref:Uncharacterized protein n=1 Tax=Acrobeloides nanus TaxID=290746 RepID=A0A914DGX4_9BILA